MDTAKLDEIERLAKECLQAEEDARNSPSPYDADLAASKADLLALRFVTDHAADLVRAARRYSWLEANCVKHESVNLDSPNMVLEFRFNHLFREPNLGFAIDMRIQSAAKTAMEVGRE